MLFLQRHAVTDCLESSCLDHCKFCLFLWPWGLNLGPHTRTPPLSYSSKPRMRSGLVLSGLCLTTPKAPEYHVGSLPLSVLEDKPRTLYAQMLPGDQTFRSPVTQFPYLVSVVIQCWQVRNNSVFGCQALQWMAQGGFWGGHVSEGRG